MEKLLSELIRSFEHQPPLLQQLTLFVLAVCSWRCGEKHPDVHPIAPFPAAPVRLARF